METNDKTRIAVSWKVFISPYVVCMKILSFMTAVTDFKWTVYS